MDMEQLILLWEERPLLWDKSLEESERQKQEQGCLERNLSALFPGFEEKSAS